MSQDGLNGTNGTNGENGADGVGITWKGEFTAAPETPEKGWAYYNSTEKASYIWDGENWQVIAKDGKDGKDGKDAEPAEKVFKFSVSSTKKVAFSSGNLQYNRNTNYHIIPSQKKTDKTKNFFTKKQQQNKKCLSFQTDFFTPKNNKKQ